MGLSYRGSLAPMMRWIDQPTSEIPLHSLTQIPAAHPRLSMQKTVLAGLGQTYWTVAWPRLVSEAALVKYSSHHCSFRAYKQRVFTINIVKHGFEENLFSKDFKGHNSLLFLENSLKNNGFVKRVRKCAKPCDFRKQVGKSFIL
jgi:hypothetical protein